MFTMKQRESLGFDRNRLERINKLMQRYIDEGKMAGMVTLVARRGQIAHFDLDYKTADGSLRSISGFELAKAINAHMLDEPIAVVMRCWQLLYLARVNAPQ